MDVAIDRRPTLFPFLVSLVHSALGYSYRNVFLFNLLVLPVFLVVSYRLAKSLGGETFGVVASLLAAAHPVTLLSVRSGGFDFLRCSLACSASRASATAFDQSPAKLAILWMNLCMFATVAEDLLGGGVGPNFSADGGLVHALHARPARARIGHRLTWLCVLSSRPWTRSRTSSPRCASAACSAPGWRPAASGRCGSPARRHLKFGIVQRGSCWVHGQELRAGDCQAIRN